MTFIFIFFAQQPSHKCRRQINKQTKKKRGIKSEQKKKRKRCFWNINYNHYCRQKKKSHRTSTAAIRRFTAAVRCCRLSVINRYIKRLPMITADGKPSSCNSVDRKKKHQKSVAWFSLAMDRDKLICTNPLLIYALLLTTG